MAVIAATFQIMALFGALALLNALAFWQRHIFIYILVGLGDIVFGLYYAWAVDPFLHVAQIWSAQFAMGVIIVVLGVFCEVRAAMKMLR